MKKEEITKKVNEIGLKAFTITGDAALVMYGLIEEAEDIDIIMNNRVIYEMMKQQGYTFKENILGNKLAQYNGVNVHYTEKEITYIREFESSNKLALIGDIYDYYKKLYDITKQEKYKEMIEILKKSIKVGVL